MAAAGSCIVSPVSVQGQCQTGRLPLGDSQSLARKKLWARSSSIAGIQRPTTDRCSGFSGSCLQRSESKMKSKPTHHVIQEIRSKRMALEWSLICLIIVPAKGIVRIPRVYFFKTYSKSSRAIHWPMTSRIFYHPYVRYHRIERHEGCRATRSS